MLVGDTPLYVSCAKAASLRLRGNYGMDELKTCGPDIVCNRLPDAMDFMKRFLESWRRVEVTGYPFCLIVILQAVM